MIEESIEQLDGMLGKPIESIAHEGGSPHIMDFFRTVGDKLKAMEYKEKMRKSSGVANC
jgi:hypothetical protein